MAANYFVVFHISFKDKMYFVPEFKAGFARFDILDPENYQFKVYLSKAASNVLHSVLKETIMTEV